MPVGVADGLSRGHGQQSENFDFSQIEARLRDFEEQLESTRVLMAGVSFSSLTNTGALVTQYAPTSAG